MKKYIKENWNPMNKNSVAPVVRSWRITGPSGCVVTKLNAAGIALLATQRTNRTIIARRINRTSFQFQR